MRRSLKEPGLSMKQVARVIKPDIPNQPHVYAILLNWNGWRDTIECLESVFRLNYPRFTVIVCDNASTDGSVQKIEDWARGSIPVLCSSPDLSRLITPPIQKPIPFISMTTIEASAEKLPLDVHLVLLQTGSNLGFAGGNNVGIRYALAQGDCDYVWLLNNDTVAEPGSLSAMVRMAEADPKLGICGSQLRSYAPPHEVQTMGGRRYSHWTGRTKPLQAFATPPVSTAPGAPDYIEGASMLISRSCLEEVGLLDETYFLYYEELDFVKRARPSFKFGYSRESIVYHKEGASIGSASMRTNRSVLSEFYSARNRIVFARRHHPWFLLSVLSVTVLSALQRIMIGRPRSAVAILRGAFASFSFAQSQGQAF
jgi:GT2 family glycosyltransferase